MAESPSHKFGQIIGNLLEAVVGPILLRFAEEKQLYLDHQKNPRKARNGKKVTWEDDHGNVHDLDYVLEKDGTDTTIGNPVAFIEVAWRRYTKHSRNKAQEIQGAILPLAEKYRWSNPFLGAVLSGIFTTGSLEQLRSLGFHVLYFPYDTLVAAFAEEGIDIAFDESTPDAVFRKCVKKIDSASKRRMGKIKKHLVGSNQEQINEFMAALSSRLERVIEKVVIIPLYGTLNEFTTIDDAIKFLNQHRISENSNDFRKYEVIIRFSNGDRAEGSFREKERVKEFLHLIARQ
jgi:hypothetical protein